MPSITNYSNSSTSTSTTSTSSHLHLAANLIQSIDEELQHVSSSASHAAKSVEDARRNARQASEVARRYTARSYAGSGSGNGENGSAYEKINGTKGSSSGGGGAMDENTDMKQQQVSSNDYSHSEPRKDPTIQQQQQHSSSLERLARSHAEDVLALSLELERTKQALEQEQLSHDDTRSLLTQARAESTQLDNRISLLQESNQQVESHYTKLLDEKQVELEKAQGQVQAAEEDAQLALDLARGNAESRELVETWLERALQEISTLRETISSSYNNNGGTAALVSAIVPTRQDESDDTNRLVKRKPVVRFADSPTIYSDNDDDNEQHVPPPPAHNGVLAHSNSQNAAPSKRMVAAGRTILHRTSSTTTMTLSMEQRQSRRNELRQRLQQLDKETNKLVQHDNSGNALTATTSCKSVTRILRECGQRLGLDTTMTTALRMDSTNVEAVARHFCQTVESKVQKQTDDIQELQALCDYLENKLVVNRTTNTRDSASPSLASRAIEKNNGLT